MSGKERLMNLLLSPHVTEKTSQAMQNQNQYTFKVRRDATRSAAPCRRRRSSCPWGW